MKNKKRKYAYAWFPVSRTNVWWVNWGEANKRTLIEKLNHSFNGWRKEGFEILKGKISAFKEIDSD